MKLFHIFCVATSFALSLPAQCETVDLGSGTIDLPAGVQNQFGNGLDSTIGDLVSSDGTPKIGYDIGGHFDPFVPPPRNKRSFFRHGTINGCPWFACSVRGEHPYYLSVKFYRAGPAQFGVRCTNRMERLKALRLILRFKPKKEALELERDAQPPATPPAN